MTILEIILGIAFLVAVIGLGYYMITINRFKRFLHFEADAKANPSDDKKHIFQISPIFVKHVPLFIVPSKKVIK